MTPTSETMLTMMTDARMYARIAIGSKIVKPL
jgi:hypothetical protein